jgi:hypothetical protein
LLTFMIPPREGGPVSVRDPASAASLPAVRALAFASIAVPVSLVGHLAGGGPLPDDATVLLAAALAALAYRLVLATRERSWPVLCAALGSMELALHWLFGAGPQPDGQLTSTAGSVSMPDGMGMPGGTGMPGGLLHDRLAPGLSMIAVHLLAAVVLGWVLRSGERVLWAAARRAVLGARAVVRPIVTALSTITVAPLVTARRRTAVTASTPLVNRRRYRTTGGLSWRGPPERALAA